MTRHPDPYPDHPEYVLLWVFVGFFVWVGLFLAGWAIFTLTG